MTSRYEMKSDPHGICIIFNNQFAGGNIRKGTGKDRNELKSLFRSLRYKVIVEENKSAYEMYSILKQQNVSSDNERFDSFVCCFLSHGDYNSIHGNDDMFSLSYTAIWSLFGEESSTLRNKPKIFIVQSCQTAVTSTLTAAGCSTTGTDSSSFHSSRDVAVQELKIEFDQSLETEHADIVFIHSSVPGKLLNVAVK